MNEWGTQERLNLSGAHFLQTLPSSSLSFSLICFLFLNLKLNASKIPAQGLSSERRMDTWENFLTLDLKYQFCPERVAMRMFIVQMNYFDSRSKMTWSRLMRRKMIVQFMKLLHVTPLGWLILLLGSLLIISGWTFFWWTLWLWSWWNP